MRREQQKLQFRGTPNSTRSTIQSLSLPVTLERCNHHPQTRFVLLKTASRFTRGNRRIGSDRTRQHLLPPPSVPPRLLISSSKHLLNSTHRGWRFMVCKVGLDFLLRSSQAVLFWHPKPKRRLVSCQEFAGNWIICRSLRPMDRFIFFFHLFLFYRQFRSFLPKR
jgi:hypothetical protein